jgi:hypothetical protein
MISFHFDRNSGSAQPNLKVYIVIDFSVPDGKGWTRHKHELACEIIKTRSTTSIKETCDEYSLKSTDTSVVITRCISNFMQ